MPYLFVFLVVSIGIAVIRLVFNAVSIVSKLVAHPLLISLWIIRSIILIFASACLLIFVFVDKSHMPSASIWEMVWIIVGCLVIAGMLQLGIERLGQHSTRKELVKQARLMRQAELQVDQEMFMDARSSHSKNDDCEDVEVIDVTAIDKDER